MKAQRARVRRVGVSARQSLREAAFNLHFSLWEECASGVGREAFAPRIQRKEGTEGFST